MDGCRRRLAVEHPEIAFDVVLDAFDERVGLLIAFGGSESCAERRVVATIGLLETAIAELVDARAAGGEDVGGIGGIDVDRHQVLVFIARGGLQVVLVDAPFAIREHLYGTVAVLLDAGTIAAHGSVEVSASEAHETEVVVLRTVGGHVSQGFDVLVPHRFVLVEDAAGNIGGCCPVVGIEQVRRERSHDVRLLVHSCIDVLSANGNGGDVLIELIGVANLGFRNVELHDAKARGEISILVADVDIVDGLVAGNRLHVVFRHVHAIAVGLQQVDVLVVVDDNQSAGLLVPCNVGDAAIAQRIHLAKCANALIVDVVEIQVSAGEHKQLVASLLYFRDVGVGKIGAPRTDAGRQRRQSNKITK